MQCINEPTRELIIHVRRFLSVVLIMPSGREEFSLDDGTTEDENMADDNDTMQLREPLLHLEHTGVDVQGRQNENRRRRRVRSSPDPVFTAKSFTAIMYPVSATMVLAALSVKWLVDESTKQVGSELAQAYVKPIAGDGSPDGGGYAFSNVLLFLGVVVLVIAAMTFCIVCLVKYNLEKFFGCYLMFAFFLVLAVTSMLVLQPALRLLNVPVDTITYWYIVFNFAAVGILSIFMAENSLFKKLGRGYLICVSVIIANIFSHFDFVGEEFIWGLLMAVACYDLCAVLTPCGPLKLLIEAVGEKQSKGTDSTGGLNGLLYEAEVSNTPDPSFATRKAPLVRNIENPVVVGEGDGAASSQGAREGKNNGRHQALVREPPVRAIKLGLGDFIFYSVLVATAGSHGGYLSAVASIVCVLAGLAITLLVLVLMQKPLPALPFSIFMGVICYAITRFCTHPFLTKLSEEMVIV